MDGSFVWLGSDIWLCWRYGYVQDLDGLDISLDYTFGLLSWVGLEVCWVWRFMLVVLGWRLGWVGDLAGWNIFEICWAGDFWWVGNLAGYRIRFGIVVGFGDFARLFWVGDIVGLQILLC